jgi:N-acetylmuramoyl-L-alanine amidase-like protein
MFIRLVVAAVLALAGGSTQGMVPASSAKAAVVATNGAPTTSPVSAATAAATVPVIDERSIVVPPVGANGEVVVQPRAMEAGTLVADTVASGRVVTPVIATRAFQTVGVTWPRGAVVGGLGAEVRARVHGTWTAWTPLDQGDSGPDAGSSDATRAARSGSDPVWVGDADAVQLSFAASATGGPRGLSLSLVDSAQAPAASGATVKSPAGGRTASVNDAVFRTAAGIATVAAAPHVITRAEWGASPQACTPGVASGLVGAVLHHTADPNTYSTVAEAMQQIRNDQAYHINSMGWCDIGYNFLVDKWGNIYEGRAGSIQEPVIGAHAGGFNTGTVGIAMIGTYSTVTPSAAMQEAVAQVIAWRLAAYHRDPTGTMTYTTSGGSDKYAAGTTVTLPVVVGHRDVYLTACPGNAGYATLPWVRARARQLIAAGLVNPSLSTASIPMGGTVSVVAPTISNLNWTLTVTDARTGVVVSTSIGYAQEAFGGVVAPWAGRNLKGQPVGPGPYQLTVTATQSTTGLAVVPWSGIVQVTGSQNPPVVAAVPLQSDLTFVAIPPTRLVDTRPDAQSLGSRSRMDVVVAGVAGIPTGAAAVALNITAVNASAKTFLSVWPAGQSMPASSVLNTDPSRTVATHVVVGVGGEGKVSIYNNLGSVHLAVDVSGYYVASGGSRFAALTTPTRLLDTRLSGGPLSSGGSRTIQVGGVAGIPTDATAAVVNVTSVGAQGPGYLFAVPSGTANPNASTVNHQVHGDATNRATVALVNGRMDVRLVGGSADAVVDVVGWYGPGATATFTPIIPVRAYDSRTTSNPWQPGETRSVAVRGFPGAPADMTAVAAIVTATEQTARATYVTAWAQGSQRPGTSDLNTGAGRDQSNLVVSEVAAAGSIQVYNNLGTTHLAIDVCGYFH